MVSPGIVYEPYSPREPISFLRRLVVFIYIYFNFQTNKHRDSPVCHKSRVRRVMCWSNWTWWKFFIIFILSIWTYISNFYIHMLEFHFVKVGYLFYMFLSFLWNTQILVGPKARTRNVICWSNWTWWKFLIILLRLF